MKSLTIELPVPDEREGEEADNARTPSDHEDWELELYSHKLAKMRRKWRRRVIRRYYDSQLP